MQAPADFGPIYAETDLSRFPVEPFNTFSNLIFLLIVVVFALRTKLDWKQHALLVGCLPFVLIGFVGGSVFHATRSNSIWLVMDFLPILVLGLVGATYFWFRVIKHPFFAATVMLTLLATPRALLWSMGAPRSIAISWGYAGMAVTILLPALIDCARRGWVNFRYLLGAVLFFGLAVFFRSIDLGWGRELLPMGTHFLWHLCGGCAVYLLFEYLYSMRAKLLLHRHRPLPPQERIARR